MYWNVVTSYNCIYHAMVAHWGMKLYETPQDMSENSGSTFVCLGNFTAIGLSDPPHGR